MNCSLDLDQSACSWSGEIDTVPRESYEDLFVSHHVPRTIHFSSNASDRR